jgi:hypothetical protein
VVIEELIDFQAIIIIVYSHYRYHLDFDVCRRRSFHFLKIDDGEGPIKVEGRIVTYAAAALCARSIIDHC